MPFEYKMKCRDCRHAWTSNKVSSSIRCPNCGSHNVKLLQSKVFKDFVVSYA